MRNLSLAETAVINCTAGFASHVRVLVQRGATWTDLFTLLPGDYLLGVSWSDSTEAPVGEATVSVVRNGPDGTRLSLAPMVVGSFLNTVDGAYVPLLREGAYFRVEVATVPLDTLRADVPADAWREVWRGRVDEVDAGGDELRLVGRDLGGLLQDTWIEVERNYGSTAGTPVQTVIQSILNDNGMGSFGLYTPLNPLSVRGPYVQEREPLLDAVRSLAEQIGWDVRMRWRQDASAFALTLWSPNRLTDTPVATFGPTNVLELGELKRSLEHVRNVVEVVYSDKLETDSTGTKKRKTVTATNPTSVALYGRRWMQVAEGASSLIDTTAEAQRLADAAIADLSESALSLSLTLPGIHWYLEAADLVQVLPDGVHFDTSQRLGVLSVEHECASSGEARTKLQLQGRPSTSRAVWAEKDARPGVAESAPFTGPPAPAGLVVTSVAAGFALSWAPATTGASWDSFELHVSSTSGFTPSQSTFKATARTTRFEVADLIPGRPYFARVVPRDAKGNQGPASAQVSLTAGQVGPNIFQPAVSLTSETPNPGFEANNIPGAPPDAWLMETGAWGVDAMLETTTVYSGTKAVRFAKTGAAARLASQSFAVNSNDILVASAYVAIEPPAIPGRDTVLFLEWYDRFGTYISSTIVATQSALIGNFTTMTGSARAPSTTSFARVTVGKLNAVDSQSAPYYAILDSCRVIILPAEPGWTPMFGLYGTGYDSYSDVDSNFGQPMYSREHSGRVYLRGALRYAGTGTLGATLLTLPPAIRPTKAKAFTVETGTFSSTSAGRLVIQPTGVVQLPRGATTFISLDGISYQLFDDL
ncbi:hypothetical protein D7V97_39760 [Corallococcus sp. CA053C]|uniref:fibronectin type III domain-containing protein n=1 Tax=Corallococcus sp. CA053C TaxID=2316732 RepID=UPI000EA01E83|nr:fibronectin type III domain-containing protein [Corallococcus sp. CA053C]RKG93723.1 hypothetical protein D7V97_39760 [Corallococcus sp. CA053C]